MWVRQFLERLALQDVPLDALRFYFSGAKGFHVELPHTLFGGFEPSAELHSHERAAALELMAGIPFDRSVYDKLRLWRLPNTLNVKGNHYKVRLSLSEILNLDMAGILALAEHPRPRMLTAPDEDWNAHPYLVEVWRSARGLTAPQPCRPTSATHLVERPRQRPAECRRRRGDRRELAQRRWHRAGTPTTCCP